MFHEPYLHSDYVKELGFAALPFPPRVAKANDRKPAERNKPIFRSIAAGLPIIDELLPPNVNRRL